MRGFCAFEVAREVAEVGNEFTAMGLRAAGGVGLQARFVPAVNDAVHINSTEEKTFDWIVDPVEPLLDLAGILERSADRESAERVALSSFVFTFIPMFVCRWRRAVAQLFSNCPTARGGAFVVATARSLSKRAYI